MHLCAPANNRTRIWAARKPIVCHNRQTLAVVSVALLVLPLLLTTVSIYKLYPLLALEHLGTTPRSHNNLRPSVGAIRFIGFSSVLSLSAMCHYDAKKHRRNATHFGGKTSVRRSLLAVGEWQLKSTHGVTKTTASRKHISYGSGDCVTSLLSANEFLSKGRNVCGVSGKWVM